MSPTYYQYQLVRQPTGWLTSEVEYYKNISRMNCARVHKASKYEPVLYQLLPAVTEMCICVTCAYNSGNAIYIYIYIYVCVFVCVCVCVC